MAVIKSLLLQATLRGLRRIIVWSLLLVFGCIDYVHAAVPEEVALSAKSDGGSGGLITAGGAAYRFGNEKVILTCSTTGGGPLNTKGYRFLKGETPLGDWQTSPDKDIPTFATDGTDTANCGEYTCEARDQTPTPLVGKSPKIILTLICKKNGNECGQDDKVTCDITAGKEHCKCKFAGVFPATCDECKVASDCGDHSTCSGTPKVCGCTYAGKPKTCDACNATLGCNADSKTPRCAAATASTPAKCAKCNDAFCKTIKGKEVCDAKEGNCKAKDKTSDAATVTSTACLVIASVVVALMN